MTVNDKHIPRYVVVVYGFSLAVGESIDIPVCVRNAIHVHLDVLGKFTQFEAGAEAEADGVFFVVVGLVYAVESAADVGVDGIKTIVDGVPITELVCNLVIVLPLLPGRSIRLA
jgi:hypothetical protein